MIDIIKENANDKADFDSETFENNFERVFNEHYSKIDNYIIENNLSKIHFLIDMPYQKSDYGYYINNNNKPQWLKIMPLTQKIINIITKAD